MPRRSFRSEINSLLLAFQTKAIIIRDPVANRIMDDYRLALQYYRVRRQKKYLLWGLLVGRSVDAFTLFFIVLKGLDPRRYNTFNRRIRQICHNQHPLTNNPAIQNDLNIVRNLRNDLFHNAGRHFTPIEIRRYVFSSIKALVQLINYI